MYRQAKIGAFFMFLAFVIPWVAAAICPYLGLVFQIVLVVEACATTFMSALIGCLFLLVTD
jgi:hypothetical protein